MLQHAAAAEAATTEFGIPWADGASSSWLVGDAKTGSRPVREMVRKHMPALVAQCTNPYTACNGRRRWNAICTLWKLGQPIRRCCRINRKLFLRGEQAFEPGRLLYTRAKGDTTGINAICATRTFQTERTWCAFSSCSRTEAAMHADQAQYLRSTCNGGEAQEVVHRT